MISAEFTPTPIVSVPPKKPFPVWPLIFLFGFLLGAASIFAWQRFQPTGSVLVAPSPSPAVSPEPVDLTADWKTYMSEGYNFSFKYPSDWKQFDIKPGVSVGFEGKQFYQLSFQILDNPQRSSSRDYVDEMIKNSAGQPGILHFDNSENITFINFPAVKLNNVFAFDRGLETIYVAKGDKVFYISYPIKAENPNLVDPIGNYDVVQQILSTFKFTD